MVPWSDNVLSQLRSLIPKKLDPGDFVPSERSFPFCDTPTTITDHQVRSAGPDVIIPNKKGRTTDGARVDLSPFIEIGEDYVTFRMQRGSIKEHGVNGCQIDDIIKFAADTITVLNKKFSCRENSLAITKLEEAWLWCQARKLDREARNVEGRDKD